MSGIMDFGMSGIARLSRWTQEVGRYQCGTLGMVVRAGMRKPMLLGHQVVGGTWEAKLHGFCDESRVLPGKVSPGLKLSSSDVVDIQRPCGWKSNLVDVQRPSGKKLDLADIGCKSVFLESVAWGEQVGSQ